MKVYYLRFESKQDFDDCDKSEMLVIDEVGVIPIIDKLTGEAGGFERGYHVNVISDIDISQKFESLNPLTPYRAFL